MSALLPAAELLLRRVMDLQLGAWQQEITPAEVRKKIDEVRCTAMRGLEMS